jgi:hypothetical protein
MAEAVAYERELQASESLSDADLQESIEFCRGVEQASSEEIEAHDFFLSHLPADDTEVLSLVLRVQLLVDHRVREFVLERMLNPDALEDARLSAEQWIRLAEALTLPSANAKWLWDMARRLNKMRNKLAHNLDPGDMQTRIKSFASDYARQWPLRETQFIDAAGHLYGQIAELARIAREKGFRVRPKPPPIK